MKKLIVAVAALAVTTAFYACGRSSGSSGTDGLAQGTGTVHVALNGGPTDQTLATVVIQNVFDPTQSFLVDCQEKNHPGPNGEPFCDELLVLPPGVYEIIVQSQDPDCRSEQNHYKVIVQPNQTTEIAINLVCGADNGGLDVIVTEENAPTIGDIDFSFPLADGGTATGNKFYCAGSGPMTVSLTVTDPDDPTCAGLDARLLWTFTPDGGVPGPTYDQSASLVQNGCTFSFVFDVPYFNNPAQLFGLYDVTFEVTDGQFPADGGTATGLTGSFTFPIHLLDCGPNAGQ